jgi:hypothetical protein
VSAYLAVAQRYYQVLAQSIHLAGLLTQAPLFQHYHQPSDTYEKLSEATSAMAADAVGATLGAGQPAQ